MAQAGELSYQQAVAYEVGERNDTLHPKLLPLCLKVLQVLRHVITHIDRIALRGMQALGGVIRQNHVLTVKWLALPLADRRHEGIRDGVAAIDEVVDEIGEIQSTFALFHNFVGDEDAVGSECRVRQVDARQFRRPAGIQLFLADGIVGEDEVDFALQLHLLCQLLSADKYVQRQGLLILQQQVAALLYTLHACHVDAHLRGIALSDEETSRGD